MKKLARITIVLALSFVFAPAAHARNDKYILPIDSALQNAAAAQKSDGAVKIFFNKQETPQIITKRGSEMTHQRSRTNRNIDEKACTTAFLLMLW
jgi:hypothetical protein